MSSHSDSHSKDAGHGVNIMACFMALLVLTAGEVALFEIWTYTHFVPKYVMVLMILVLTLPKAAIVAIYFMHLKFEKQFIVWLALFPILLVFIAVLPTLVDAVTLKNHNQVVHKVDLGSWVPPYGKHGAGHAKHEQASPPGTTDGESSDAAH